MELSGNFIYWFFFAPALLLAFYFWTRWYAEQQCTLRELKETETTQEKEPS